MNHTRALLFVLASAIGGCANTTAVLPSASSKSEFEGAVYSGQTVQLNKPTPGAEVFRIFQQGATGFVSVSNVREGVDEIATKHCARMAKIVRPIQETASKPPHILGNFPRVEWLFECIDSPQLAPGTRPTLDRFSQLERLKQLLDNGALTQQEFDREKSKLLATP